MPDSTRRVEDCEAQLRAGELQVTALRAELADVKASNQEHRDGVNELLLSKANKSDVFGFGYSPMDAALRDVDQRMGQLEGGMQQLAERLDAQEARAAARDEAREATADDAMGHVRVLQASFQQLASTLADKADRADVDRALDLKAGKASVTTALHRKLNKAELAAQLEPFQARLDAAEAQHAAAAVAAEEAAVAERAALRQDLAQHDARINQVYADVYSAEPAGMGGGGVPGGGFGAMGSGGMGGPLGGGGQLGGTDSAASLYPAGYQRAEKWGQRRGGLVDDVQRLAEEVRMQRGLLEAQEAKHTSSAESCLVHVAHQTRDLKVEGEERHALVSREIEDVKHTLQSLEADVKSRARGARERLESAVAPLERQIKGALEAVDGIEKTVASAVASSVDDGAKAARKTREACERLVGDACRDVEHKIVDERTVRVIAQELVAAANANQRGGEAHDHQVVQRIVDETADLKERLRKVDRVHETAREEALTVREQMRLQERQLKEVVVQLEGVSRRADVQTMLEEGQAATRSSATADTKRRVQGLASEVQVELDHLQRDLEAAVRAQQQDADGVQASLGRHEDALLGVERRIVGVAAQHEHAASAASAAAAASAVAAAAESAAAMRVVEEHHHHHPPAVQQQLAIDATDGAPPLSPMRQAVGVGEGGTMAAAAHRFTDAAAAPASPVVLISASLKGAEQQQAYYEQSGLGLGESAGAQGREHDHHGDHHHADHHRGDHHQEDHHRGGALHGGASSPLHSLLGQPRRVALGRDRGECRGLRSARLDEEEEEDMYDDDGTASQSTASQSSAEEDEEEEVEHVRPRRRKVVASSTARTRRLRVKAHSASTTSAGTKSIRYGGAQGGWSGGRGVVKAEGGEGRMRVGCTGCIWAYLRGGQSTSGRVHQRGLWRKEQSSLPLVPRCAVVCPMLFCLPSCLLAARRECILRKPVYSPSY
jgi:hypothetical protein